MHSGLGNSGDALHCSHVMWTVESELIHSPLFTLQNSEDGKMQQKKKKQKEKGKSMLLCTAAMSG
jgi:hypothetical protein